MLLAILRVMEMMQQADTAAGRRRCGLLLILLTTDGLPAVTLGGRRRPGAIPRLVGVLPAQDGTGGNLPPGRRLPAQVAVVGLTRRGSTSRPGRGNPGLRTGHTGRDHRAVDKGRRMGQR